MWKHFLTVIVSFDLEFVMAIKVGEASIKSEFIQPEEFKGKCGPLEGLI